MTDAILFIMNFIGIAAFSVSGALIAISSHLDLFGVLFIGCITSFGGGIVRDICLGSFPPRIFFNAEEVLLSISVSLAVFIISYINAKHFKSLSEKIDRINNWFDAVGLAVFSITGTEIAFDMGYDGSFLLSVVMGMITGVGGGIIRDVLTLKEPSVLHTRIYAMASISGCVLYFILESCFDAKLISSFISMSLIIAIRLLATKFRWKLPKIKI